MIAIEYVILEMPVKQDEYTSLPWRDEKHHLQKGMAKTNGFKSHWGKEGSWSKSSSGPGTWLTDSLVQCDYK